MRKLGACASILTLEDRAEITRVRHPALRQRATTMRIVLRRALSNEVGGRIRPSEWRFERSAYGKPRVAESLPQVHFSISHTQGASLIALSRTFRVGIDIEAQCDDVDDGIVTEFFTRSEQAALARLPATERVGAFVRLWTVKEAYAKLVGIGLAADSSCLEFDLEKCRLVPGYEAAEEGCGTRFETWSTNGETGRLFAALAIGQARAESPRHWTTSLSTTNTNVSTDDRND